MQIVYPKPNDDILQKHCSYDCAIDPHKGSQTPFAPIYKFLQNEHVVLKEYID